jgi:hypothetical protein
LRITECHPWLAGQSVNLTPALLFLCAANDRSKPPPGVNSHIADQRTVACRKNMVAPAMPQSGKAPTFAELLRPDHFEDGNVPEERVVHCGISWERYLALDKALGDDRPGPRFYYLDGELEIMTASNEHERDKKWIGIL